MSEATEEGRRGERRAEGGKNCFYYNIPFYNIERKKLRFMMMNGMRENRDRGRVHREHVGFFTTFYYVLRPCPPSHYSRIYCSLSSVCGLRHRRRAKLSATLVSYSTGLSVPKGKRGKK